MIDWIKDSKFGLFTLALAVAALLTLSACAGSRLSDFIKYQNPPGVQKALQVSPTQSLSEAPYTIEQWELFVTQNTNSLFENVERAEGFLSIFSSVISGGLNMITDNPALAATPLGGLLVLAIGNLSGLIMPQPGSARKLRKEKEESYNAGLKKGKELA